MERLEPMNELPKHLTLVRKLDRVYIQREGKIDDKPVKLVWARPISGKGREVAILDDKKKEIVTLKSLDCLDPEARKIAAEELDQRYLVARIKRVISTQTSFGSRYWDVETDRGRRRFVMKDPHKNVVWITKDRLVIRDVLGNRYEIHSIAELDPSSRHEMEKII